MAIVVHLPEEKKSVAIPECSTLKELSHHRSRSIQKLAFSHVMFKKIFGYIELIHTGEITHEQAEKHIKEFAASYNANILEFDSELDDEISNKIFKLVTDDSFSEKYDVFFQIISGEIFKLFASGVMSYEEGYTELGTMPAYMNPYAPTQA